MKKQRSVALNRLPRAAITVPGLTEFRKSSGNALQHMLWVLRCPAQGQELDLVILGGPLQLRLFYDYESHCQVIRNATAEAYPLSFQKATFSFWTNRAWSGIWKKFLSLPLVFFNKWLQNSPQGEPDLGPCKPSVQSPSLAFQLCVQEEGL